MIYEVTAIAVDPQTGDRQGRRRTERIDTETNSLFRECQSEWDVEDAYEAFWNRLDGSWEQEFPANKEKVMVLSVRQLS